jgi:hypothetical protein
MPGGSLVCYTGHMTWYRDATIFAKRLEPRPLLYMPHTLEQRIRGVNENIRIGGRPVLWFSRGRRRNQLLT